MGEVVHGGISGLVSKILYGEKIGLWVPGTMPISLSQLPPSGRLPCLRSMILCVGPGSARPLLAHSGLSFRDVARPGGSLPLSPAVPFHTGTLKEACNHASPRKWTYCSARSLSASRFGGSSTSL